MRRLFVLAALGSVFACRPDGSPSSPPEEPPPETTAAPTTEPSPESPPPSSAPEPEATEPAATPEASEADVPADLSAIPECVAYITEYERCEEQLKPMIMAGDLRFASAERAWLEHIASTPERATLPDACRQMLADIRPHCPPEQP